MLKLTEFIDKMIQINIDGYNRAKAFVEYEKHKEKIDAVIQGVNFLTGEKCIKSYTKGKTFIISNLHFCPPEFLYWHIVLFSDKDSPLYDKIRAYAYYNLSVQLGAGNAVEDRDNTEKTMTMEDILEAQKLSEDMLAERTSASRKP